MRKKRSLAENFSFVGIGIDVEEIGRFEKINLNKNKSFLKKNYTKNELNYCLSKKFSASHLAVRFSGKEAIYKALDPALDRKGLAFNRIEIINRKSGAPIVKIKNSKLSKFKILISLSHSKNLAIAMVIILKKAARL